MRRLHLFTLPWFVVLLILAGIAPSSVADSDEEARKLSQALQRALDNSNFGQKRARAELRDVGDVEWKGFRLLGPDGQLRLDRPPAPTVETTTASAETTDTALASDEGEGGWVCGVCGAHLFGEDHHLEGAAGFLTFAQPAQSTAVVTDLHSEWSADNTKIELRCAMCGNHLGHVDPGADAEAPLRFVIEPDTVETADAH